MPASLTLAQAPCATCGAVFPPKHARQKYCSKPCLWKAKNDSTRARRGDEINALRRERYASDPAWREAKREERARSRGNNPEKAKAWANANFQKTRISHPWLSLLYSAKDRAKARGIEFSLTPEWAETRWSGLCELSGLPFLLGARGAGPKAFSPSIDRIEPTRGYTPGNCRFVLMAVNALKGGGTDADMYLIAESLIRLRAPA